MAKAWMIDELAHAGDEHLDPSFVDGYDRKQGSVPDEAAALDVDVLERHGLGAGATIVDLGAGTGRFAVAAARRFARVVAVDVSPEMLRVARSRADDAGQSNIDFVQAGFLSYEHEGPPADGVYTRNALHQLPDFWKALALVRVSELLRPRGVLRLHDLIFDFRPAEADAVFDRWLADAATEAAHGYTRDDLTEHIRNEYSTFRWLLEPMLEVAGLEIIDADFRSRVYGAYTCMKR